MDVIWDCLASRADTILEEQHRTLRETPVYPYPASHAQEHGELEQYRASNRANIACKEAIEAAIREHYHDNQLDNQAAAQVVDAFGLDRTLYVLANTVQQKDWDARFSPGNKEWAKSILIQKESRCVGHRPKLPVCCEQPFGTDRFVSQHRPSGILSENRRKRTKPSVRAKTTSHAESKLRRKHSAKLKEQDR